MKITNSLRCKFCGNKYESSHRAHLANPFCTECYEDRLVANGAIDLRDNCEFVELADGYVQIVPIDSTKLYKKAEVGDSE